MANLNDNIVHIVAYLRRCPRPWFRARCFCRRWHLDPPVSVHHLRRRLWTNYCHRTRTFGTTTLWWWTTRPPKRTNSSARWTGMWIRTPRFPRRRYRRTPTRYTVWASRPENLPGSAGAPVRAVRPLAGPVALPSVPRSFCAWPRSSCTWGTYSPGTCSTACASSTPCAGYGSCSWCTTVAFPWPSDRPGPSAAAAGDVGVCWTAFPRANKYKYLYTVRADSHRPSALRPKRSQRFFGEVRRHYRTIAAAGDHSLAYRNNNRPDTAAAVTAAAADTIILCFGEAKKKTDRKIRTHSNHGLPQLLIRSPHGRVPSTTSGHVISRSAGPH